MQLDDGAYEIFGRFMIEIERKEGIMMGFVMVVIWKVVKSGCVCAGTPILLSLE